MSTSRTEDDRLYEVRSDNGLGGFVIGRDAADELAEDLSARPNVESVTGGPWEVMEVLARMAES